MKSPAIRRSIGPKPPGRSQRGGSSPLILCQLQPPHYRLTANDISRLLADPRVTAKGWNRAKLEAACRNISIPALHAKFSPFVPGVKITYFVSNEESGEPAIARIKEGEWIKFELTLLNSRDADTSAQVFGAHLVGAMSRYLTIQGERYLENVDVTSEVEILETLYAELIVGLRESSETLSKKGLCVHEAAEAAQLVQQAVMAYYQNVIIENWFIHRFSSAMTIPEAFFEEGATSVAASFDDTAKNTLSALQGGGIVFLPPTVIESAAYAAALEYQGLPHLAVALRGRIESALNAYIPAFLLKAFPELTSIPLALPTQQQRFLSQALLTFDKVKKNYLLFLPKIKLKPAFRG